MADFEAQLASQAEIGEDGFVQIGSNRFWPTDILRGLVGKEDIESQFEEWLTNNWLPDRTELLERIRSTWDNRDRFEDLCKAADRGQIVPFIGSGMSVPSGMPTWRRFLSDLQGRSRLDKHIFETILQTETYEHAAEELVRNMPSRLFNERFERTFREKCLADIAGPVRMIPELFDGLTVATTNYDNILEVLFGAHGLAFDDVLYGAGIGNLRKFRTQGRRCLVKLHGDFRRPETRVLTYSEYERAYSFDSLARRELDLFLRNNSLLFLGCGLTADRTMQVLLDVVRGDEKMPDHYAILEVPMDDRRRLDREHFLAERHVFPIWYHGGHDDSIEAILVGIAQAVKRI